MEGKNVIEAGENRPETNIGNAPGSEEKAGGNPSTKTTKKTRGKTGGNSGPAASERVGNDETPKMVFLDVEELEEKKTQPKKKSTRKKNKELEELTDNLTFFTQAIYSLIGTTQGDLAGVWSISENEARTIADPAAKILERLAAIETMNKYADYAALFFALSVVTVPRIMITYQARQSEKGGKLSSGEERKIIADNKQNSGGNSSEYSDTIKAIYPAMGTGY